MTVDRCNEHILERKLKRRVEVKSFEIEMSEIVEINVLVSNIVDEKHFSHCRLCLKSILDENFAKFDDSVAYSSSDDYLLLYEVLTKIFGKDACDEIPGIDAVCSECLEKALETLHFLKQYEESTSKLNKLFNNLNLTLNCKIDNSNNDQKLYILCEEEESQIIFVQNKKETKKPVQKEHEESHSMHVCKSCGKSYKGLAKLLAHEEKHATKNTYFCSKCGKTYTTKEFFTRHVKLCLEDLVDPHPMRSRQQKTYICQECGKGYSTPGGLRVHKRFVHGNAKPHVCDQCGKMFTAPCYLKVHMVTHTKEKNFPCDLCQGKFVSKEALIYHRRRHTGEKPYSCDQCDEKFVNASARAEHIKFKHIGPTLSCELCSKKFVTKNFLRLHMKKHYDPTNKLFIGRTNIPPNVPGEQNMRIRIDE